MTKKILFFSATLVAMVFMTLSLNSCKKKDDPHADLAGSWVSNETIDGTPVAVLTLNFHKSTVTTNYKNVEINESFSQTVGYSYDATTKKGTIKGEDTDEAGNTTPIDIPFVVSGNKLHFGTSDIALNEGVVYTKQ